MEGEINSDYFEDITAAEEEFDGFQNVYCSDCYEPAKDKEFWDQDGTDIFPIPEINLDPKRAKKRPREEKDGEDGEEEEDGGEKGGRRNVEEKEVFTTKPASTVTFIHVMTNNTKMCSKYM